MFKFFTTLNAKKDKANINTVGNKVFLKNKFYLPDRNCPLSTVNCPLTNGLLYF